MRVGIINYGASNLLSVIAAVEHNGHTSEVLEIGSALKGIDSLILPGVGDFGYAAERLRYSDTAQELKDFVAQGKKILGICLGMQLLGDSSTENGNHLGLGLISGETVHLSTLANSSKLSRIPRMGWFEVFSNNQYKKWKFQQNEMMYFAHSYFMQDVPESNMILKSNYQGFEICAGVQEASVTGIQFHPEKSGENGVKFLGSILSES
jgi:glutamine amidotransferase